MDVHKSLHSPATNAIYTLSLHDALPIYRSFLGLREQRVFQYVSERNEELSLSLLRPISRKGPKDVTLDFAELFALDRKSTRLNSSHPSTSYAVFCLKNKLITGRLRPHRN